MAKIKTIKNSRGKKDLPQKNDNNNNKSKTVYFRLTESEWTQICEAAARVKMGPHAFCRWDVLMRL
jgi:hypothetical protein